jgi:peptidoglycan/LPS O-acetylase OafA/YrhL
VLRNKKLHILRGLAILLVFGYHLGIPGFSGGFIGVDIFFLISGFLITTKLSTVNTWKDIRTFYIKRARKIFPSLVTVLTLTLLVFFYLYGWTEKTARYLSEATQSLLGFVNNSYMFAATAEPYDYSPFLHLWSIAIEIQFYVTAPLLLFILVRKFRFNTRLLVSTIAAGSLILFVVVSYFDPLAAYYASFGRIWEFCLGALIALALLTHENKKIINLTQVKVLSWSSLAIILVFVMGFGWLEQGLLVYALFPIAAAAMLLSISSNIPESSREKEHSSQWNVILKGSVKAVSFLADISYPLYLVHYPVLFFTYSYYPEFVFVGAFFSLLASYLIHRVVELPFLSFSSKRNQDEEISSTV